MKVLGHPSTRLCSKNAEHIPRCSYYSEHILRCSENIPRCSKFWYLKILLFSYIFLFDELLNFINKKKNISHEQYMMDCNGMLMAGLAATEISVIYFK